MEIGSPDNVEGFVDHALATKRRLMGMGHRIYKTRDPRAKHLARHAQNLAKLVTDTPLVRHRQPPRRDVGRRTPTSPSASSTRTWSSTRRPCSTGWAWRPT